MAMISSTYKRIDPLSKVLSGIYRTGIKHPYWYKKDQKNSFNSSHVDKVCSYVSHARALAPKIAAFDEFSSEGSNLTLSL